MHKNHLNSDYFKYKVLAALLFSYLILGCGSVKWNPGPISIPYEYHNVNNDYIGIVGDFEEVELVDNTKLRFICRYFNGFKDKKGGLEIQVGAQIGNGVGVVLNKYTVTVNSKNFGLGELFDTENSFEHQYVYFYIPIEAQTYADFKAHLKEDKVTIRIYEKNFEFLAPKLKD